VVYAYLPHIFQPDDSAAQYNDGRVGTAYIQELRFNTYCERLQNLLTEEFDKEFKLYLKNKGVNVDVNVFDLKFQPPQNFASYRQSEIDNARVPTYTQMSAIPYISNRFALKRFLGLTDEEVAENERLWQEENAENIQMPTDAAGEMRGVGVSTAGMDADMGNIEDTAAEPGPEVGDAEVPEPEPAAGAEPPPAE